MEWTLDGFLHGKNFSSKYGRLCLPVLVARAERYKRTTETAIPEFTYGDLATIVVNRKYAYTLHHALGSIGCALNELNTQREWKFRKIPPIQLMVWTSGQGRPGDEAFGFLGISKQQIMTMPIAGRQALAKDVLSQILSYPHWREVLTSLNLQALTLDLPASVSVAAAPDQDRRGGESIHHKRLKHYVADNYHLLGLKDAFSKSFEVFLLSGDKVDLLLDHCEHHDRVCIEVKSRISSEEDIIRGVFQCLKYAEILDAQERYELQRGREYTRNQIRVFLVMESKLSPNVRMLAEFFNVQVLMIRTPDGYRMVE